MPPPDAIVGWDDELNADLYDRFTRDYPFYADTSRDLASRAGLADAELVVDLCGGTGITAEILLDAMPPHGRVISVDASKAMQTSGRRGRDNPRITWITAKAEDVTEHISGPVDAVVCNSAIWKTDTRATFAAAKRILRPGGRFVFNVGGGFAGLPDEHGSRTTPSLNDLITAVAVLDYGYVPPRDNGSRPALTAATLCEQLGDAGFTVLASDIVDHESTVEEKRAWLSIPLFARPPGQFTHEQRMAILDAAYAKVDHTQVSVTRWLLIVAGTGHAR